MAEEAQTASIMVSVMNNIDVAMIGAAAGFMVSKMTGRKNRGGMGGF